MLAVLRDVSIFAAPADLPASISCFFCTAKDNERRKKLKRSKNRLKPPTFITKMLNSQFEMQLKNGKNS